MNENEMKFIKKYINLFEKAEFFGFKASNFIYNPEKLEKDNKKKKKQNIIILVSFSICFIFTFLLINNFHKIVSIILSPYFINEECILTNSNVLSDIFLPPIDCSFCQINSSNILKIKNVNKDEFEDLYAYSGVPVVVTDATSKWKAMLDFNFNFFRILYSNDSVSNNCQFFSYESKFGNLSQALHPQNFPNSKLDRQSWYFGWGNCNKRVTHILREYYSHPYFLPDQSESSNMDWIFIGYAGKGAPSHLDRVENPSWQAQIKGSKIWKLVPPSECYFECKDATKEVLLQEGEILVVDTNRWYHSTQIVGDDISISIGSEYD